MNDTEKARIAAAIHELRPDWPAASLRSLLDKPVIANRARRDVAIALTWVACDSKSQTPARVFESGPWWSAVVSEGTGAPSFEPFDPATFCGICSQPEERCRRNPHNDHEYQTAVDSTRRSRKHTKGDHE